MPQIRNDTIVKILRYTITHNIHTHRLYKHTHTECVRCALGSEKSQSTNTYTHEHSTAHSIKYM